MRAVRNTQASLYEIFVNSVYCTKQNFVFLTENILIFTKKVHTSILAKQYFHIRKK